MVCWSRRMGGTARDWMAVGARYWTLAASLRSQESRPRSEKLMMWI